MRITPFLVISGKFPHFLFTLLLISSLTGCGGGSSGGATATTPCSSFDCLTSKFNLVTANLDGNNLAVIATDSYREMTHPRITLDRKWIAYTRFNTIGNNGCAEEKSTPDNSYFNTGIRVASIDGSTNIELTTPNLSRFSTNAYWIGNTYDFTFLEGDPRSAVAQDKLQIKRGSRSADMNVNLGTVVITPTTGTFTTVFDPQQVLTKIVFGGQYTSTIAVKSIFTMNLDGSGLTGITIAADRNGAVVAADKAFENDPKLSPDGTKIAFMRKINTGIAANDHGFNIFVTNSNSTPGAELNRSIASIGADPNFNDAVPEWIDNTTLVFFTLNITSTGLVQKLYTMKDDGTLRTEILLPTGYYYSHVIPYRDAQGNTKILFAANKSATSCRQ